MVSLRDVFLIFSGKMDDKKLLKREFLILGVGLLLGTGLMFGVFALLKKFDLTVLWGGLAGIFLALLNFFLMAVSVWRAADRAEQQDVAGGKRLMQLSMFGRYALLLGALIVGAKSGVMNVISMLVPLLLVRPILSIGEFFRKSGEKQE